MNDAPTNDPLAKRVLARIREGHLAPRMRLYFIFENYVFWGLGALAVLLGAVAFSAGLFEVENAGWDLYPATNGNLGAFLLETAPFLWVLALAAFVALGYWNIRRTKCGYRYPLAVIALGAVLTSIPLGSALYTAGVGGEIESALGDHPPFYRPILIKERSWWAEPEEGLLGGTITSSSPDLSAFTLVDFSGAHWTVNASELSESDRIIVARGGQVRVVGIATATSTLAFHACFVFPWRLHGMTAPPLAAPVAIIAPRSATNTMSTRTPLCKGLRPYEELRVIDADGL